MTPKAYITVICALLAGLILGHWAPQADLRAARQQLEELKRNPAGRKSVGGAAALEGVQSILNLKANAPATAHAPRRGGAGKPGSGSAATPGGTNAVAGTPGAAAPSGAVSASRPADATQRVARASFSNELDKIRQTWALRAQIARTNFASRVQLNDTQQLDFDTVVEAMNLRLGSAVENWVAAVGQKETISSEDGLRIMHDVSSALVLTYDEMDRRMPPGWRDKAGTRFELVNFVDPDVLTPLEDVQGLLDRGPGAADGAGDDRPPRHRSRAGVGARMGAP